MRLRSGALLGAFVLVAAGCSKASYRVGDNLSLRGGSGGNGGNGGSVGVVAGTGGLEPASCRGPISPGPAPLSRLTMAELGSTLAALLGSGDVAGEFESSEPGRYEASPDIDVSAETIETLHRVAHQRAESVTRQPELLQQLTGCDVAVRGDAGCKSELYERFVARAFRRPLTDADRAEMDAVYADGKALGDGSHASGARAVIEVTLQSPELMYLVAEGDGTSEGDLVPLTGHETASRLAYFLTGAPPDDELWQAATGGRLDDASIAEHARRLLGTAQNRRQLRSFFDRRLGLAPLEAAPDEGYSSTLAELTREAAFKFVEDVTFETGGTFATLMTSPVAFLNDELAKFYGVEGVSGSQLQRVTFDTSQRRGLLTQPAWLRADSPGFTTRPVLRAVKVLKSVLCVGLPDPPPTVPDLLEPPSGPMNTMRERLISATNDGGCASCHALINPVGWAFESYDAFGRHRTLDNGFPIDASGVLQATDAQGPFADALELIERVAASEDAARCFQDHWLAEAYRRKLEPADECAREHVASAVTASDGKITDVMLEVAQSANLKYRMKAE